MDDLATNLVCSAGGQLECVFVCFPSKNKHGSPASHSFSSSLFFCFNFVFPPYRLLLSQLRLQYFLLFYCSLCSRSLPVSSSSHFLPLPPCCITVAPCTLLPLSHVCHSLSTATIQQLCPDFSEALGSKIQYLPGQTQNQYPPNANTAHRQFSRSANDAGSYPATEFSDYRAETTTIKKKSYFGCIKSIKNVLQCCT